MSKIKALLFDLDGTIVDNMEVHIRSWAVFLKKHGIERTEEQVYKDVAGKTTEEALVSYFGRDITAQQIQEFYFQKESLYKELYLPILKEIPGVTKLLQQAQLLGLPMAIASAAGLDNIEFVIKNLKIADYFKAVVCAQDVKRGKPDPEIFLLAASRLGINPADCLVFEDSLVGVEGAQNAGMKAVAITTGHPQEKLSQYPGVIKVVDDYCNLDLSQILN